MKIYRKEWDVIIPPYVRGLTFDGVKGLFVHTEKVSGDVKVEADLIIETSDYNPADSGDVKALLTLVAEKITGYTDKTAQYPGTIVLGNERILRIGKDYSQAASDEGCSVISGTQGSESRSDVVRGKIALVTGGAQGFGEGMVSELVGAGAFVYIADMNFLGAQKLAASLNKNAGTVVAKALEVNVTSDESVSAMMESVALETGGLDLFISNAGVLKAGSVKEMELKDFNFVTSVDYTGFFLCAKYSSRLLAYQNAAAKEYMTDIIAISSKSGLEGSNKNGAYAGAKFGTIGLTQSFALELVTDNIKVNAICPGNFLDGPLWSDPDRGLFVQYLNTGKVPGAETVDDVRKFYEAKVPLNRGCKTIDVIKAVFYIVEQQYETGQAVPVTGGQVMLN
jgi:sorbitol-6-phosphate 2-dehydrogenase